MAVTSDDRRLIADLCTASAILLDERRFAEAAALFAEDAVLHRADGSVVVGRNAIQQAQSARHPEMESVHLLAAPYLEPVPEVDGQVRGRSNFVAVMVNPGAPDGASPVMGFFEDRFVRVGDGWRIAERRVRPVYRQQSGSKGSSE